MVAKTSKRTGAAARFVPQETAPLPMVCPRAWLAHLPDDSAAEENMLPTFKPETGTILTTPEKFESPLGPIHYRIKKPYAAHEPMAGITLRFPENSGHFMIKNRVRKAVGAKVLIGRSLEKGILVRPRGIEPLFPP